MSGEYLRLREGRDNDRVNELTILTNLTFLLSDFELITRFSYFCFFRFAMLPRFVFKLIVDSMAYRKSHFNNNNGNNSDNNSSSNNGNLVSN